MTNCARSLTWVLFVLLLAFCSNPDQCQIYTRQYEHYDFDVIRVDSQRSKELVYIVYGDLSCDEVDAICDSIYCNLYDSLSVDAPFGIITFVRGSKQLNENSSFHDMFRDLPENRLIKYKWSPGEFYTKSKFDRKGRYTDATQENPCTR